MADQLGVALLHATQTCEAIARTYVEGIMPITTNDSDEFSLVYTGVDPVQAGMLQRMLEAEGITCRHLGTHFPAEVGLGALACEQRLEVPSADVEQARELIAAATESPSDTD